LVLASLPRCAATKSPTILRDHTLDDPAKSPLPAGLDYNQFA